ncbi:MAG: response regulator [Desulfatibacillum sp.]|nr:response regulator [Desulfatibacillum sp.]
MTTMSVQDCAGSAPPWENQQVKNAGALRELLQEASRDSLYPKTIQCILDIQEEPWENGLPAEALSKALSGLFQSAVRHVPPGGHVQVTVANVTLSGQDSLLSNVEPGAYVKICITNSGPEMESPPANGANIINLPGLVHIPGPDGSITFFLPVLEIKTPSPKQETPAKQRILIMDDDEAVCEIASQMLKFIGFEAAVSMDGDEAISMYQEARNQGQPFAAVILDLTVPDGPGAEETVKRLTALDPNVVALISSGYFDDPAVSQFQEHGFSGAIAKPFRIKALASALKAALTGNPECP